MTRNPTPFTPRWRTESMGSSKLDSPVLIPVILATLLCFAGTAPFAQAIPALFGSSKASVQISNDYSSRNSLAPGDSPLLPRNNSTASYQLQTWDLLNNTLLNGNYFPVNAMDPSGICFDSGTDRLLVAETGSNSLGIVDARSGQVTAEVSTGQYPGSVACGDVSGKVYVANQGTNNVSVIYSRNATQAGSIPVGQDPRAIAYDPLTDMLYVANYNSGNVTVVSGQSGGILASIPVGSQPSAVGLSPFNDTVYVTNFNSDTLTVINGGTSRVTGSLATGIGPDGIAFDTNNQCLYVTDFGSDSVSVLNASTGVPVTTLTVGNGPSQIAFDSLNGYLYVADTASNTVTVINGWTNSVVMTVSTGPTPEGLALDLIAGHLYVADAGSDYLSILNVGSDAVLQTLTGFNQPTAIAYDSWNGEMFVENAANSTLSVLNGSTGAFITLIPFWPAPSYLIFDPQNGYVYGVNSYDPGEVEVVNGSSNKFVTELFTSLPNYPFWEAFDPANGNIYLTDQEDHIAAFNTTTQASTNINVTNPVTWGYARTTGITYDSANGYLYVSLTYADAVSVINPATGALVSLISFGIQDADNWWPGSAYNAANGYIYVIYNLPVWPGTPLLGVINGATNTIVKNITIGNGASAVVSDTFNDHLYEINSYDNTVDVISGETNRIISTVTVGSHPIFAALDTATGNLYVTDQSSNEISILNGGNNEIVGSVPLLLHPTRLALGSGGWNGYLTFNGSQEIATLGAKNITQTGSLPVTNQPTGVVPDPVTGNLFVDECNANTIEILNPVTGTTAGLLSAGACPTGGVYDPANGWVYIPDTGSRNVTVVNATSEQVVGSIGVGLGPDSVAYDPASHDLVVTNSQSGTVSIIDGSTDAVLGGYAAGSGPDAVTIGGTTPTAFVADSASDQVFALSIPSGSPAGVYPVGNHPDGLVLNQSSGLLYVANQGSDNVSVVYPFGNVPPRSISVGRLPTDIILDPIDGDILVVNSNSSSITVLSNLSGGRPTLTSVLVSSSRFTLSIGTNTTLRAVVSCAGGPCQNVTYGWQAQGTIGKLNASTGPVAYFFAGQRVGFNSLRVNATMYGRTLASPWTSVHIVPALSSVTLSPISTQVPIWGAVSIAATATCLGGPCPAGINYTWSAQGSLGNLTQLNSSAVQFSAGGIGGTETVGALATLNGLTATATPVSVQVTPVLRQVTVSPVTATLLEGTALNLSTNISCQGGSCPAGTAFSWQLSGGVGTLSSSTGSTVTFQSGNAPGTEIITVEAALGTAKVQSYPVTLTVISARSPKLLSVSITPSTSEVSTGDSQQFRANSTCIQMPCPTGVTYTWELVGGVGQLNSNVGPTVTFTAGYEPGEAELLLNATWGGKTLQSTPVNVTVVQAFSEASTPWGVTGGVALFLSVVIAGVCTFAFAYVRRDPSGSSEL